MPKDSKQQVRTPVRRAASKEALKQMHLLLGDERKLEISDDDDDVIEVEVQPPKKKYKMGHRKSTDGNDRDVLVVKPAYECPLDLEVVVEDLTSCQQSREDTLRKEYKEVDARIKQLLSAPNHEVVYNGVYTKAVQIVEKTQAILAAANPTPSQFTVPTATATAVQQSVGGQSIVLQQPQGAANNTIGQSYQLVMDPRLGMIVGAVSTPTSSTNAPPLQLYQSKILSTTTPVPSGTVLKQVPANTIPPLHKATLQKGAKVVGAANKTLQVKPILTKASAITTKALTTLQKPMLPTKGRPLGSVSQMNLRPTESNVEGGLTMGTKPSKSIDLTGEDGRALPDSREVSFNKLQGRTYPSLVVVARPHLRVKDLAADRAKLDVKVKSVLMYPPTKFTEWLIQQGLVRSDQKCSVHASSPLKLGMYSDTTKFPYSGGYVWISECCPQRFVSVFSGSLFEGSQHPPMSILKLLYHWCCQTIVQNVTQWVKVDNLYVKGMYTWLRSVCTVALHTHLNQLGGPGVKVQVGVISLGTTSQDGNKREVKVEVLGVMETATRHIRLRAVEPLADGERNYKKRFAKILEPIFTWVHPSSIIVTDLTVDKATLHQMGFMHVVQNTLNDYSQSNRTIMEYLRRIVPRMFQNTLSLLSRQIIQQFLDELVWREWYGTTVLLCFDNILQHLSEQTRFDSPQSLITRLNRVAANPFKNWSITAAKGTDNPLLKRYNRQRKTTPQPLSPVVQDVVRPSRSTSPDVPEQMVPLENYYYGTITPFQMPKSKVTINMKCPFCKLTFNTNIFLMNHLFKHAHNVSNDVQLCKYCLTIVPSSGDLLKHISTTHPDDTKIDNKFLCLICETVFRNPFLLGKHMSQKHCPSELPYLCGTCGFRCSNHKQAVDHFYQQHDHGTTIQCPFCLKSTTIFSGGRNISQNMNYFIQHLQKHQKKLLAKKCNKCTLWFIQKEFLKDHLNKMHVSQRGKHGLVPSFAPRNGVMVPKSRMDKSPDDGKVINFSVLVFNVSQKLNCKECDKPLNTPKHFVSFENCQNTNCQYSTCCSESMQNHAVACKQLNSQLPAEKLPYKMFCVCGYSDVCGNMMAKHLAICERRSAYPSEAAAKNATATHSMLDVLGLVRKPEEASSSKQPLKHPGGHLRPIILKDRGRPRKYPLITAGSLKIPKKKADVGKNDFNLSISEVRGGVDVPEIKQEKIDDADKDEVGNEAKSAEKNLEEKNDSQDNRKEDNEPNETATSAQREENEEKEIKKDDEMPQVAESTSEISEDQKKEEGTSEVSEDQMKEKEGSEISEDKKGEGSEISEDQKMKEGNEVCEDQKKEGSEISEDQKKEDEGSGVSEEHKEERSEVSEDQKKEEEGSGDQQEAPISETRVESGDDKKKDGEHELELTISEKVKEEETQDINATCEQNETAIEEDTTASEAMDVDSVNEVKDDKIDTKDDDVAVENTKDICPMDTD